jgi:hypothetical protein
MKSFFHSTIYNRKWAYLSSEDSTPPQLTSAQWFLFRLWQLKNEEMEALTLLHSLQMRRVFIPALPSEKRWMKIKKSLSHNWQLIQNFFIAHLPILERCKTKGAGGAVCA